MSPRSARRGDSDILAFVKYFHAIEQKVGISRIEQKLRELERERPDKGHTTVKNRILEEITRAYGISSKILLHSTKRGNVTQARVMAIILFHKHLKLTKSELADLFGHSQPNIISLRIKTFTSLLNGKPIYESERRYEKVYSKDFMEKFNAVDAIILEYANARTEPLTDWKKW